MAPQGVNVCSSLWENGARNSKCPQCPGCLLEAGDGSGSAKPAQHFGSLRALLDFALCSLASLVGRVPVGSLEQSLFPRRE